MIIDTSNADAMLNRLTLYVTEGWKDIAAEEAKQTILDLTAVGMDADGNRFHQYSDGHAGVRARLGLPTEFKDLRMGRLGLLPGLKPRRRGSKVTLAVADSGSDKLNKVAHGQMYHPRWEYHHKFLAVGDRMMQRVVTAIVHPLAKGIADGLSKLHPVSN